MEPSKCHEEEICNNTGDRDRQNTKRKRNSDTQDETITEKRARTAPNDQSASDQLSAAEEWDDARLQALEELDTRVTSYIEGRKKMAELETRYEVTSANELRQCRLLRMIQQVNVYRADDEKLPQQPQHRRFLNACFKLNIAREDLSTFTKQHCQDKPLTQDDFEEVAIGRRRKSAPSSDR